jgi:hypothetical protein
MGYNKETRAKYLAANKERIAAQKKAYYTANKEKVKAEQKTWRASNRDKLKVYYKTRLSNDVMYRLKVNVKNLIGNSIRKHSFKKLSKTEQILGCTYQQFKEHLEAQFDPWMTWENRGLYNGMEEYGWDIDHIIPLSSATCEAEVLRLNHYTNLRPLCSHINRDIKRNQV